MNLNNIPQEMRDKNKWVLWRYGDVANSKGKFPKNPVNAAGYKVNALDEKNWLSFAKAEKLLSQDDFRGIGFVLTGDYIVIDADNIVSETFDNVVSSFGQTFIETSVSGQGLHVWLRDVVYNGPTQVGPYEIYKDSRYIAVTGDVVNDVTTIADTYQDEFDAFLADASVTLTNLRTKAFTNAPKQRSGTFDARKGVLPLSQCNYDKGSAIDVIRHEFDIQTLLEENEYTFVKNARVGSNQAYYRRPGKADGVSLVVHTEANVCKCFSSSDPLWPIQEQRTYLTAFDVWRGLTCPDLPMKAVFGKAYRMLRRMGYEI